MIGMLREPLLKIVGGVVRRETREVTALQNILIGCTVDDFFVKWNDGLNRDNIRDK